MAMKRTMRHRTSMAIAVAAATLVVTACGSGGSSSTKQTATNAKVTLQFSQWWANELPKGDLDAIVSEFETQNPNITIKLITNPYQNTHDATIAQAATHNMSDVVAMDGTWYSDLQDQGALANMSTLMAAVNYNDSTLSGELKTDGSVYMIPAVNFVYPMFVNLDLLHKAGITSIPTNQTEFKAAADAVSKKTSAKGFTLALSSQTPNGVANDVMAWVWASGGSMLTSAGKTNINNAGVAQGVQFVDSLYKAGDILPGSLNAQETQKPNSFAQGQVAMMFDSLAHVTTIEQANPKLNFTIAPVPVQDGYTGQEGINAAAWSLGISKDSKYQAQAWKFVQFLMSPTVDAKLSSEANGFAGNKAAKQDLTKSDPLVRKAATIYASSKPLNEFADGLPVAVQLESDFDAQLQKLFTGSQDTADTLKNTQSAWDAHIAAATK
jgi:multiple sugar transport system substrate-binding protein